MSSGGNDNDLFGDMSSDGEGPGGEVGVSGDDGAAPTTTTSTASAASGDPVHGQGAMDMDESSGGSPKTGGAGGEGGGGGGDSDSDSDGDGSDAQGATAKDIFGGDVSDSDSSTGGAGTGGAAIADIFGGDIGDDSDSDDGAPRRDTLDTVGYDEVNIPPIARPEAGKDFYTTRLPKIITVQREEFDENNYDGDAEVEAMKASGKPLATETVIRWRYRRDKNGDVVLDDSGNPIRESNSRFVQWSDGSIQLQIGAKVFDVVPKDIAREHTFLYAMQVSRDPATEAPETCLESHAGVSHRLLLRPHGKGSKASMVAVRKERAQRARVQAMMPVVNPEREKEKRIKVRDQLNRNEEVKRKRERDEAAGATATLSTSFLEDTGSTRSTSISDIKRRSRLGEDDDDEDDDEDDSSSNDDEEHGLGDSDDDDDDKGKSKRAAKKSVVVSDDEDDDESDVPTESKSKRSRTIQEDESDSDDDDDDDDDDDEE